MIKLIYEFDKVVTELVSHGNDYFSGVNGRARIRDIILNDLIDVNLDGLRCPTCGGSNVVWKYKQNRTKKLIWDNPDEPIFISLPIYTYQCFTCEAKGHEMLTTDLMISGTDMSYHYLFSILYAARHNTDHALQVLMNLLYERNSDSRLLKLWQRRFILDFKKLPFSQPTEIDAFLCESVPVGDAFKFFFMKEHRFFLHKVDVNMIFYIGSNGKVTSIRNEETDLNLM